MRRADVVLQSFRAGVAERHGYTGPEMLAVNPDLVYLNAPGYGTDGPCGHRPAFAPTIGAGSGLAYRNIGGIENLPQVPDLPVDDVKRAGDATRGRDHDAWGRPTDSRPPASPPRCCSACWPSAAVRPARR